MKIITFKYNRSASAIQQSRLMSDKNFAMKNVFKLSRSSSKIDTQKNSRVHAWPRQKEYCISGSWQ